MTARRIIAVLAFLLWSALTFLTLYVLFTEGPDVLVFISLVFMVVLGMGIFGALNERRGGPR
ncbi:MAG: hypothetical protein QOI80_2346 [Solirubrobacteraceae bacterium]|nr:hypothetical protein [Solirubrobacteraceae bacterium]